MFIIDCPYCTAYDPCWYMKMYFKSATVGVGQVHHEDVHCTMCKRQPYVSL